MRQYDVRVGAWGSSNEYLDRIEAADAIFLDPAQCEYNYCWQGACVPGDGWRALRDEESRLMASAWPLGDFRNISVAEIPVEILSAANLYPFSEFKLGSGHLKPEAADSLALAVVTYLGMKGSPFIHGLNTRPPGLRNASYNPKIGLFAGMHVDHWGGTSYEQRTSSALRVCINLGPDPRYLLFLPYSIAAMVDELNPDSADQSFYGSICRNARLLNPDLEVLRLRILPGEAYIANVDTIVHDASTLGGPLRNSTFDFRAKL